MAEDTADARKLCRLDDIPDGEGKSLEIERNGEMIDIFVVRRGEAVHGYHNICPHLGTPLSWVEDEFMTFDRQFILCAMHGAEFRIEDGRCTVGPCQGDSLDPFPVALEDGWVLRAD